MIHNASQTVELIAIILGNVKSNLLRYASVLLCSYFMAIHHEQSTSQLAESKTCLLIYLKDVFAKVIFFRSNINATH